MRRNRKQPQSCAAEPLQITLHGGRRYGYRIAGSGDEVIVLLHGIAGSCATWEEVMPPLATRYTVIAPDLIGHGESAKPEGDYSLGAYANALRDVLETLGYHRVTLVGHSLGGGVAMQFAYQFPARTCRLALVSSGGLGREVHPMLRAAAIPGAEVLLPWLSVAAQKSVGRIAHALGRLGLRAGSDVEESWAGFVSLAEPEARRAFIATVRNIIDLGGQRVRADELLYLAADLPTLILWGAKDPLIPAKHAEVAHRKLPNSRVRIFPDAGHFPHRDDPRAFVQALVEFIDGTRPPAWDDGRLRRLLRSGPKVA